MNIRDGFICLVWGVTPNPLKLSCDSSISPWSASCKIRLGVLCSTLSANFFPRFSAIERNGVTPWMLSFG